MYRANGVSKVFQQLKKNLRFIKASTASGIKKIESAAKKSGDARLLKVSKTEKKNIEEKMAELMTVTKALETELTDEVRQSILKLKEEITNLSRQKDAADSNSLLLEYKKKDLQLKAQEIENAYDDIAARNKELLVQQKEIERQTEELRLANEAILEKNQELETRTESLLDQSDYLHEANETIAGMMQQLGQRNEEILRKNEELLSLNLEKNNLIGIVAHDLKSPLNQIKGLLSLIKMTGKVDEESGKYLGMMDQSATRLNDMIAKILDVEAIESRQMNLKIETINLSEVLNGVSDRYKNDAIKKNIVIITKIAPNGFAQADRSYAEQVLENLLSNAIKFSPYERSVYVNLDVRENAVVCEIKDQGPGLNEEDKKKLFGKYQKLSAKPTGNEISTGLGLSIVKKFVEAMGGEIWCESEVGNGASFFVKFKRN
ncbi:hypothetical protein WSM22_31190 [Cytophagales bacterium WSM2-2]|nr:hypothetical protein WSM22_31190 [Cytophagales bacterium WSM2-2]